MNTIKKAISATALVVTFLFLPGDTWSFWMLRNRELLYAELIVKGPAEDLAIAKNLLDAPVTLEGRAVQQNWSFGIDNGPAVDLGTRGDVLPTSYSVIRMTRAGDEKTRPRSLDGGKYFVPAQLILAVPAEHDRWIVLMLLLLAATVWLTWSVERYVREGGLLEVDKD